MFLVGFSWTTLTSKTAKMTYIVSLWYLCKLILYWIEMPINIRSSIKYDYVLTSLMAADFLAWNLYHICHIVNGFYRRMMHAEDKRPPNEKLHAYYFSITYNGCDFCLLTPSVILAISKCLFKGWRLKFYGLMCLRSCSRHCNWNWSALYKDEHKKMRNIRNCWNYCA